MKIIRSAPGPNLPGEPVIQLSSPDPGQVKITTAPPSWELSIDVSHGDRDLEMVHAEVYQLPGAALLKVCAEHYRGASLHNHAVWVVSPDGRVLWSRPWQCSDTFVTSADTVWLIKRNGNQNRPPGAFPLEVHALNIRTGEPMRAARRLRLPAELVGRYDQAWEFNAGFKKKGREIAVVHTAASRTLPLTWTEHVLATLP